jgi:hypothetical protein
MALDVIDISTEGLAAYVVAESRTGKPPQDPEPSPGIRRPNGPFNGM